METINHFMESNLDLKLLRNGFIFCFAGILLIIPVDIGLISMKTKMPLQTKSLLHEEKLIEEQKPLESLSSYEGAFQKSTLFGLYTEQTNLPVFKSSIQELTKDLRLKGIVVLNQAEAIIEDATTQKTTFLQQGDQIGELTVKEIKDGEVILSYYGEEKKLRIE